MRNIPVIVIVDDSAIVRRIVKNIILGKIQDAMVYTLSSGNDLLENYDHIKPDVVILDNLFPITEAHSETGRDILSAIKVKDRNVDVIIYSAQCQPDIISDFLALGASNYVTKPATAEVLGDTVLKCLSGGRNEIRY